MNELHKWLHAARAARTTCGNVREFDQLVRQQEQRLGELKRADREARAEHERLSFGFPNTPDGGTIVGTLPPSPNCGRKRRRTPEQAEIDRQLRKEREASDLDAFLLCYFRATGNELKVEEEAENPDFIVARADGQHVGVELTAVRESPEQSFYRSIVTGNPELDPNDAVDQMCFLIDQKSSKIPNYKTKSNILVLQNEEADFNLMCAIAKDVPIADFASAGFDEIWLADYSGIRKGMHQEIELFGLYPERVRTVTRRSGCDQKPYR